VQLVDLKWRLAVGLSSSLCSALSTAYVTGRATGGVGSRQRPARLVLSACVSRLRRPRRAPPPVHAVVADPSGATQQHVFSLSLQEYQRFAAQLRDAASALNAQ
jgi:hypothetical protein